MLVYGGIRTFLKAKQEITDDTKYAIIGMPYDDKTTYRSGARMGPSQVREASMMLTDGDHPDYENNPSSIIADVGDVDKSINSLETVLTSITSKNILPVVIGGDHSYTLDSLKVAAKNHGKINLIHFDAHCDIWEGESNHGTFLREAIDLDLIDSVTQIGIRSPEPKLYKRWRTDIIQRVPQSDILDRHIVRNLIQRSKAKTYITFDIDCYDAAIAPGTGTPEPGGLSFNDIKIIFGYIFYSIKRENIIGFDMMEVSPPYDSSDITSILAANTIYHFLCGHSF